MIMYDLNNLTARAAGSLEGCGPESEDDVLDHVRVLDAG